MNNVRFAIEGMQLESLEINKENTGGELHVSLKLDFEFGTSISEKFVGCLCRMAVIDQVRSVEVLRLSFSTIFKIEPEDWDRITDTEKKWLNLPIDIIQHFAALSFSSARGIVFVKGLDMGIDGLVLPLVNIKSLIPGPYPLPL